MKIDNRRLSTSENRRRVRTLMSVGAALVALAALLPALDPVGLVVRYRTRVRKGSELWELLSAREAPGVRVAAYLFNVTNADRFLAGRDRALRLAEVGPFTYQEFRTNENMEIDSAAGVLRYSPVTRARLVRGAKAAHPSTVRVLMPNVAMLSMSSMMATQPYFARLGFNMLLRTLKTKPIVAQTAEEFLWGYKEPLIKLGNTLLPGWINFDTIGLLDRLYDNTLEYRLEVGVNRDDRFRLKTVNGAEGLKVWDYDDQSKRTECNSLRDAYEGIAYPTGLAAGAPIQIYRNVLCRLLPLQFEGAVLVNGSVPALRYAVRRDAFRRTNRTACLCDRGMCIDGVSDLSPCFYSLPLALSNAHFLYGDKSLFERVEGLNPDEEKHGSEFLIEPRLGLALKTSFSVQVNVVVRNVSFSAAAPFSDMVVPVCYFKLEQPELEEKITQSLYLLYCVVPYCFWALFAALLAGGLLALAAGARALLAAWIYPRDVIIFHPPEEDKAAPKSSVPLLRL